MGSERKAVGQSLFDAWEAALEARRRYETDQHEREEQEAYDRLVDFVEAHGLNYTHLDPRGPKEQA